MLVPAGESEAATAQLLDLFPPGFAWEERAHGVEYVLYLDADGVERLLAAFPEATSEPFRDDWEDAWKAFHVPAVVGPLWIGPPWRRPPPRLEPVVIEPGRAFGTGAHPTTRLCLAFLLELGRGALLDVGCGSGVLAIAAAKLGYGPVVAVDLTEAAVEATRRNAAANGVELEVRHADARADPLPRVAVAVANIALEAVEAIGARLRADRVVASGYLTGQRPRLASFRHVARRAEEPWAADLYERE